MLPVGKSAREGVGSSGYREPSTSSDGRLEEGNTVRNGLKWEKRENVTPGQVRSQSAATLRLGLC